MSQQPLFPEKYNTKIAQKIRNKIAIGEQIDSAALMEIALQDPEHGYYRKAQAVGAEGDFVTAPEVSQIFGEVIAAYLAYCWLQAGDASNNSNKKLPIALVELGAGQGTLMADILRSWKKISSSAQIPLWQNLEQVMIVESNEQLRANQQEKLSAIFDNIIWFDDINAMLADIVKYGANDVFVVGVANEFLDALPVRQYEYVGGKWQRRLVGWDDSQQSFYWHVTDDNELYEQVNFPDISRITDNQQQHVIYEDKFAARAVVADITKYMVKHGYKSAWLWADYGYVNSNNMAFGDSFQAVRNHQYVDIFDFLGEADLTYHIDFTELERLILQIAKQNDCHIACNIANQGDFLKHYGADERLARLCQGQNDQNRQQILSSYHRLTDSNQMGDIFKIMSVIS